MLFAPDFDLCVGLTDADRLGFDGGHQAQVEIMEDAPRRQHLRPTERFSHRARLDPLATQLGKDGGYLARRLTQCVGVALRQFQLGRDAFGVFGIFGAPTEKFLYSGIGRQVRVEHGIHQLAGDNRGLIGQAMQGVGQILAQHASDHGAHGWPLRCRAKHFAAPWHVGFFEFGKIGVNSSQQNLRRRMFHIDMLRQRTVDACIVDRLAQTWYDAVAGRGVIGAAITCDQGAQFAQVFIGIGRHDDVVPAG